MGISCEKDCGMLGHPTLITPDKLAKIMLFCWHQPAHICIRDRAVMPIHCAI
ncbi:short-chain dehydrogenase/reductase family protein [Synechococcus sp. BMK-MC-1]|nr:short-chain dehydrogenase/reductase family protein [Synechococcus sp. BMK-MC-1]